MTARALAFPLLLALLPALSAWAQETPSPAPSPTPPVASEIDQLGQAFRDTGVARSLHAQGFVVEPFGHGVPSLRCAPLRVCAIQLEPGEKVLTTALGDSERWQLEQGATGAAGAIPLVVLKPSACDLRTNLLITTSRRVYQIQLEAPACKGADGGEDGFNPRLGATELLRFWYPEDLVRRWTAEDHAAATQAALDAASRVPLAGGLDSLNFDYDVHAERHYPWTPSQVFDDGRNTYVRLPAPLGNEEMPVLFAVQADGKTELLNYAVAAGGRVLVADRVLRKAHLVVGAGKNQRRLTLINRHIEGH